MARLYQLAGSIAILASVTNAMAWENHSAITYYALQSPPPLNEPVRVESLQTFLQATHGDLPRVLDSIEKWAKQTQPAYHPRPDALRYDPSQSYCSANLERCFREAIRTDPETPLSPMAFDPEGRLSQYPVYPVQDIYLPKLYNAYEEQMLKGQMRKLRPGDLAPFATVVAAESLRPDLGLDIGLYDDSGTAYGTSYGFGNQPFHIPGKADDSIALFHLSSLNLDSKFFKVKPELKPDYIEYRFHEYLALARFAEKSGHPYWAAVFDGWATHYLEDATQPYHADLFAGYSEDKAYDALKQAQRGEVRDMLLMQARINAGHDMVENTEGYFLGNPNPTYAAYRRPIVNALAGKRADVPACTLDGLYLKKKVLPATDRDTKRFTQAVLRAFPKQYSEPNKANPPYDLPNAIPVDITEVLAQMSPHDLQKVDDLLQDRLHQAAAYVYSCATYTLAAKP